MLRFTTRMTGLAGAPYYSTQYTGGNTSGAATAGAAALSEFWDDIKGYMTAGLAIKVLPDVEQVDAATGNTIGTYAVDYGTITTTGNAPLPKAVQGLVRLRTNAYVGGRRVQGRIFIPSLANDAQTGGKPSIPFQDAVEAAMGTLLPNLSPAGLLEIYSRTNFSEHTVVSASCWDEFAVMRSRRD